MDANRGLIVTDTRVVAGIAHDIREAVRGDHTVVDPVEGFPHVVVRSPDGCECILSCCDGLVIYDEECRIWWGPNDLFRPADVAAAAVEAYRVKFGEPGAHVQSLVWLRNGCRYVGVTPDVCVAEDTIEIAKYVEVVLGRWGRARN